MSFVRLSNFTESIEKAYEKSTTLNESFSAVDNDAYDWSEEAAEDKAKFSTALEREIARVLRSHGYNPEYNSVVAAAEYIEMAREYADEDYSVEEWLKDTEDNYPEELEKIDESVETPSCDSVDCALDFVLDDVENNGTSLESSVDEASFGYELDDVQKDELSRLAKSHLGEAVEDVYWYSNSEFKEDLAWLANNLTDYFFREMESAHWGLSKKDITNIFNGALNDVLKKMRESDECTLFESKSLEEDMSDVRPNHMKILDAIENGYIDYETVAEELLRWMPDNKLGDFVNMYLDYEEE